MCYWCNSLFTFASRALTSPLHIRIWVQFFFFFFDRVGKEMTCNRCCSSSTLERSNGGGQTVDHIFSKHLSAISFSLLSVLTSLLYIGGAHIFDVSLIISLNWVVNFITAYKKSITKVTRKNQSHKINSSIDNLVFMEHRFKLPHLPQKGKP